MKRIKIYLSIVFFLILLFYTNKVSAAGSISLSASKSTVTVGDEFSISVNLSGASVATLTARVTVDTSKVEYVSGPSNSSFSNGRAIYTWTDPTGGDNPKTSGTIVTFKFRAKQTGKASFSVNGDFYSPDEKNIQPSFSGTSVTIQEKTVTPPTPPQTGGNTGGSSGGNTGGSNSGGSSGGGSGTTSKPNTGGSSNNNSGSSQNKPSTGNNETSSNNANLKELHLDVEGLNPAFHKNTTNYHIVVPNDKNRININAIPEDAKAKVNVTGNESLPAGSSKITIKVTAQDNKTTKTYTINVTKTDDPNQANANLENLAIENVTLDPEFNENILQYYAQIGSNIDTLNILAVPQVAEATAIIQGNENLQYGENTITINVTAKDGVTTKQYILTIYKKTPEEEQAELEPISLEPEEDIQEENKNGPSIGNIVFMVIVVSGILGIIYVIVRKYRKEK